MTIQIIPIDVAGLYRREFYTDGKAGTVVEKTPIQITEDGEIINDPVRAVTYDGQTYINGQMLEFPIPAKSFGEACKLFAQCVGGLIQELQSREIQSRIARPMNGGAMGGLVIDQPSRKRS